MGKRRGRKPLLVFKMLEQGKICAECAPKVSHPNFKVKDLCSKCKMAHKEENKANQKLITIARKEAKHQMKVAQAARAREVLAIKRANGTVRRHTEKEMKVMKKAATKAVTQPVHINAAIKTLLSQKPQHENAIKYHKEKLDQIDNAIEALKSVAK